MLDRSQLHDIQVWAEAELRRSVDFWLAYGMDSEHGGVYTCLTRDGQVYSTDKAIWMQGRCAWTFANLCNVYGERSEWREAAASCLNFLEQHGFNPEAEGRMFFQVTSDGRPLRQRRYSFSEAFYAMANAEYYMLSRDPIYLERAKQAYELFYSLNHGGDDPTDMGPKVDPRTRRMRALAPPMIELNLSAVMRRADPEGCDHYNQRAQEAVDTIMNYHYKPELKCCLESVGMSGEFLEEVSSGRVVNPGHSIECSWFVMEEARYQKNSKLFQKAQAIYDDAFEFGWDHRYGGIFMFVDCLGFPPEAYEHDMKLWWPHNEALIASLMLYRETQDPQYLDQFLKVQAFCIEHFQDADWGEWYGYLRRDGAPTEPISKGTTFKGPFHLPRSLIMIDQMVNEMLKL